MASLTLNDQQLLLELSTREKIAGLHGDIEIALSDVQDVRVEPDPIKAIRGIRAPGLAIPGRTKIGTWRGHGYRSFVVARRGVPAVRVGLATGKYDELLVSTPEAEQIADTLRARIAS
jgi:uncharacterized protein